MFSPEHQSKPGKSRATPHGLAPMLRKRASCPAMHPPSQSGRWGGHGSRYGRPRVFSSCRQLTHFSAILHAVGLLVAACQRHSCVIAHSLRPQGQCRRRQKRIHVLALVDRRPGRAQFLEGVAGPVSQTRSDHPGAAPRPNSANSSAGRWHHCSARLLKIRSTRFSVASGKASASATIQALAPGCWIMGPGEAHHTLRQGPIP